MENKDLLIEIFELCLDIQHQGKYGAKFQFKAFSKEIEVEIKRFPKTLMNERSKINDFKRLEKIRMELVHLLD